MSTISSVCETQAPDALHTYRCAQLRRIARLAWVSAEVALYSPFCFGINRSCTNDGGSKSDTILSACDVFRPDVHPSERGKCASGYVLDFLDRRRDWSDPRAARGYDKRFRCRADRSRSFRRTRNRRCSRRRPSAHLVHESECGGGEY